MRSARNSNACSQSFVASRSKRMSSQPLDSQVARYDCFRGPFPITDRLTYYPFCVNTYAECVSHIYWTHYSRLSVRKFWRQHYSLRENPGFCPSWQNILRLLPRVFSANSKPSPKAVFCSAHRTAGESITKPRPLLRSTRNFAPCFPRRWLVPLLKSDFARFSTKITWAAVNGIGRARRGTNA